jgi:hypothetical protein
MQNEGREKRDGRMLQLQDYENGRDHQQASRSIIRVDTMNRKGKMGERKGMEWNSIFPRHDSDSDDHLQCTAMQLQGKSWSKGPGFCSQTARITAWKRLRPGIAQKHHCNCAGGDYWREHKAPRNPALALPIPTSTRHRTPIHVCIVIFSV